MYIRSDILSLLAVVVAVSSASAGELSPSLDARLTGSAPDARIDALVFLRSQAPLAELDASLRSRSAGFGERHRTVVEALRASCDGQAALDSYLSSRRASGGIDDFRFYWIVNACRVTASPSELYGLAARPEVDWIEPVPVIRALGHQSVQSVGARAGGETPYGLTAGGASQVWRDFGIDGTGRLVALIDTGVDGAHPALASRWRGADDAHPWQECWYDATDAGTSFPTDPLGHGTSVLGIISGLDDAEADTTGVAFGAQWIAAAALSAANLDDRILDCLQWLIDPDGDPMTIDDVPDVVENSWTVNESNPHYVDCDSRWWAAMDNCEMAGVALVFSAGNDGPAAGSIGSPADRATTLTNAFAVGSVNATGQVFPYPIHFSSSRGPSGCTAPAQNRIKPELVAPGVDIRTTALGGGTNLATGTSMSAPHVAGAVALLRQADPDLDVDTIKSLLLQTARDEGSSGDDNTYGMGFLDAYAAVQAALDEMGNIAGSARNASWEDEGLPGVRVEVLDTAYFFQTDPSGDYAGRVRAGSHVAVAQIDGFQPQSLPFSVVAGETTPLHFDLIDNAGPDIRDVSTPTTVPRLVGPTEIEAVVSDLSTVASVRLWYRPTEGTWQEVSMGHVGDGRYSGDLPPRRQEA
ncbi:MAG: S8 family serine peptidase [Candidatus Eisenbacteria bacterium]